MIVKRNDGQANLSDIINNLYKIINDLQEDKQLKQIEQQNLSLLILDYLQDRVDTLRNFFQNSFVLRWNSKNAEIEKLKDSFEKLVNDNKKEDISDVADKISLCYMEDIKFHVNEFLKNQYSKLQILEEDIYYTDKEIHKKKYTIYHNEIRDVLSSFIQIYNKILISMQQRKICMYRETIVDIYNDDDEIILYTNFSDKNIKLKSIVENLKNIEFGKMEIYLGEKDKEKLVDIDLKDMCCFVFNGYLLDEDSIYELLKFNYEVFDEEAEGSFAAQIYMNHIIFLNATTSRLKSKLKELKTRCNVKFYYFIEQ